MALVAPHQVGTSWTRNVTSVRCIGSRILPLDHQGRPYLLLTGKRGYGNTLWPPRLSMWNKEQTLTVTIYGGKQFTKKDRTGKQESSHILNNKLVTRTWKLAFSIWTFQAIIPEDKRPHQRDGSHDNCGNLDQEALSRPRSLLQAFQWVQPRPEELSS